MVRMLNRYRTELGVEALPAELEATAQRDHPAAAGGDRHARRLGAAAERRARWRSTSTCATSPATSSRPATRRAAPGCTSPCATARARRVFESGAIDDAGAIAGQRQRRRSARRSSRTTSRSRAPDQVQIYEPILGDRHGVPTTGLLTATQYLKDNRLLPRGFDKATADPRLASTAVRPRDADFTGAGDRVRYRRRRAGRPGRSPSRWSCATSRSATAGRTTSRSTTPPSRSGSSPTTTRCRRARPSSWPRPRSDFRRSNSGSPESVSWAPLKGHGHDGGRSGIARTGATSRDRMR